MNKNKIQSLLHLDQVDHWELMSLLLHHFSHAENPTPFTYKYQSQGGIDSLTVTANEEGKIETIELSKDFPEKQLEEIEKKILQNLLQGEVFVGQEILFCNEKVVGFFRYKDLFQIIPVPESAPAPVIGLKEYPFLLQFTYKKSSDMMIDYARRREKATVYTRLLNLLSDQKIRLNRNNGQAHWTLDIDETNNKASSSYRQEGYSFEDTYGFDGKQFTDTSRFEKTKELPFQNYYSNSGITSDPFDLPDSIVQSLDRIFALSHVDYERFFRACTWYEKGQDIWQDSASSSFVALVSAIETLIGESTKCKTCHQDIPEALLICNDCNQPRYQVTKHFKDFLIKHYSGLSSMPKEAAILYATRSGLAHGIKLLQQDLKPWSFGMNPVKDDESRIQRNLFFITGIVIYNWLWTR